MELLQASRALVLGRLPRPGPLAGRVRGGAEKGDGTISLSESPSTNDS